MSRTKKILISAFIVFNFLTMIRVHMPLQREFVSALYKPIDSYLSFFSLYQTWSMFSPNPARTNVHLTAEVEFDDGSTDTYNFPDASNMSLAEKYTSGERYRVVTEAIRKDANRFLWADASKFALRKLKDSNFNKIPMKVHLYRHWNIIPDMDKQFIPHLTKTKSYSKYKFYTHEVL
jgi:hypothetical protein